MVRGTVFDMSDILTWTDEGQPFSPRFQDVYHTITGALAQAQHVFLGGCGLPGAWADAPQWRVLETGFGLGLNFLATWHAWREDAQRPQILHFVSVEAYPVSAADIRRAAALHPALQELGAQLADQWHGLLPGFHRLAFDGGRVLLTLCIGDARSMLRAHQPFEADSLFLDGFSPAVNADMWSPEVFKALARFCRPGTAVATWTVARAVRDALVPLGFVVEKAPGLPPKRDCLRGRYAPAWPVRRRPQAEDAERAPSPGHCAVVGAGLAGAAVAHALALRGWRVTVLDAADHPAAGASALPFGLMAPHASPDDALLSRLTRAGIRATWAQLTALGLVEGIDWAPTGAVERREAASLRLPPSWAQTEGWNETTRATAAMLADAGLPDDTPALFHARAGWVKPHRLVAAWLDHAAIAFRSGAHVEDIDAVPGGGWRLRDASGQVLANADRVVVAAGPATRRLAPALTLQPVRGQIVWGEMPPAMAARSHRIPVNGDGHLIAGVGVPAGAGHPLQWMTGSTYDPGDTDTATRPADRAHNLARLARLHPVLAPFAQDPQTVLHDWAGVRCASADRRPLVGPIDPAEPSGPWACTALGSRGLSFAALCAELLAARWHGEPLPVPAAQARALDTRRLWR